MPNGHAMPTYLVNAFSLSMLSQYPALVKVEEVTREEFCSEASSATSAIGHQGTAAVLSQLCGFPIQANRTSIQLQRGDVALVFQLLVRLEEGRILTAQEVEALLAQGRVKFLRVTVL